MRLEDEIKSSFGSEYHKLEVNILYTQYFRGQRIQQVMKPYGITTQQYNILRILRGQRPNPANVNLLIERMMDKMSNASRLVDKLCAKGYVQKSVNPRDKRNADIVITDSGLDLIDELDPLITAHIDQLKILSEEEATHLNFLLDKLRDGGERDD